ncbi:MAG: hypothetical protein A2664_02420 [Candidatus Taylorbacteria bacterium RIFCSPHIGHO2_01_FULL_46_22b]|uniref:Putative pterin-4-alpha-carbinolamine dehydratase n=1 Tax=Candidatus Taylorbacteria bacterium RIFCSPHIGHO2_01_FULL_46_22b TaxID=1802301 RepID=A0A1G2M3F3_9BACT|nr:MAG: hypothetical protein A2664_02420 [Candidatus Taylorbacteria bacterium RIFCSPHIGHO2_01_FULL_46_22b]
MATTLSAQKCVACEGDMPPLNPTEATILMRQLKPEWKLSGNEIVRDFKFKDFKQAMVFVNKVADIAEEEGHHPDIFISYNRVKITLTTHAIIGLSNNDFIVAAKIDLL